MTAERINTVLGMYVPELSLRNICEEITDLKTELTMIELYEQGQMAYSDFKAVCSFDLDQKESIKQAIFVLKAERMNRVNQL